MRLSFCVVFCLTAPLAWALDSTLVGKWKSEADGEVTLMEIKADGATTMGDDHFKIQADGGRMKLTYQGGIAVDATYTVSGPTLVIVMVGEKETWQRVGGAPASTPSSGASPPAARPGGNPLAAPPAQPPGTGSWTDGQLTLVLRAEGDRLTGELGLGDQKYPTTASGSGASIQGAFETNGERFAYTAKVSGDAMELLSDGQTYHLKRQGAAPAPAATRNPLAARAAPAAPASPSVEPATATPETGNWLRKTDEGYDVLLPGDFRVLRQQGGAILLGSNVTPGIIIIYPSAAATAADVDRGMSQGTQETGISMTPRGPVTDLPPEGGTGKLVEVSGTLGQEPAQGLLGGFLRSGGTGGMAILAATTPASWPKLQPFADQIMRGVRFYKPAVSDRLLQARQALSGHSLVTSFNNSTVSQNSSGYYTGSAVNSFRAWHCCSSGRCRYEGTRSSSFQGGGIIGASGSNAGPLDGNWELQAQGSDYLLIFRFDGGGMATWTVSVDANENVFIDNTKVKVTTDSICNQL